MLKVLPREEGSWIPNFHTYNTFQVKVVFITHTHPPAFYKEEFVGYVGVLSFLTQKANPNDPALLNI